MELDFAESRKSLVYEVDFRDLFSSKSNVGIPFLIK